MINAPEDLWDSPGPKWIETVEFQWFSFNHHHHHHTCNESWGTFCNVKRTVWRACNWAYIDCSGLLLFEKKIIIMGYGDYTQPPFCFPPTINLILVLGGASGFVRLVPPGKLWGSWTCHDMTCKAKKPLQPGRVLVLLTLLVRTDLQS